MIQGSNGALILDAPLFASATTLYMESRAGTRDLDRSNTGVHLLIHASALSHPLFQLRGGLAKATFLEASQLDTFSKDHTILSSTHFVKEATTLETEWPSIALVTPSLDGKDYVEVWYTDSEVTYVNEPGLELAMTDDLIMGVGSFEDTNTELEKRSHDTYDRIFKACGTRNYPELVRMWNYIPHINKDDDFGLERYRTFCKGRAEAFFDQGYEENFLPAGTGIGCESPRLSVVFLAFREEGGINMENPVQMPAYHYPNKYGPKSPSFARGTYIKGSGEIFVSGTSSIIGHETVHAGDVEKQLQTSLENINRLIHVRNLERYKLKAGGDVSQLTLLKIYVRHAEDLEKVQAMCEAALDKEQPKIYLRADICRDDLAVELEGCLLNQEQDT